MEDEDVGSFKVAVMVQIVAERMLAVDRTVSNSIGDLQTTASSEVAVSR